MKVALDNHKVRMVHHLQSRLLVYFSHLSILNHCLQMNVLSANLITPLKSVSHREAFLQEPYTLL
jgi:hypothetical protein